MFGNIFSSLLHLSNNEVLVHATGHWVQLSVDTGYLPTLVLRKKVQTEKPVLIYYVTLEAVSYKRQGYLAYDIFDPHTKSLSSLTLKTFLLHGCFFVTNSLLM